VLHAQRFLCNPLHNHPTGVPRLVLRSPRCRSPTLPVSLQPPPSCVPSRPLQLVDSGGGEAAVVPDARVVVAIPLGCSPFNISCSLHPLSFPAVRMSEPSNATKALDGLAVKVESRGGVSLNKLEQVKLSTNLFLKNRCRLRSLSPAPLSSRLFPEGQRDTHLGNGGKRR